MATTIWLGTTSGDYQLSTNWSVDVPGAGSTAVVPQDASVAIDTNLDNNAVDLAAFIVEDGCAINMGDGDSPLIIGMQSTGVIELGGTGSINLQVAQAASSTSNLVVRDCGDLYLSGYSTEILSDEVNIVGGTGDVYIAWNRPQAARVAEIRMQTGATLRIGPGVLDVAGSTLDEITASKGTVYNRTNVTTVNNLGATFTQEEGTVDGLFARGGTTKYNSGSALATATIYDGDLDFEDNIHGCTVTTVNKYGTGRILNKNSAAVLSNLYAYSGSDWGAFEFEGKALP